MFVAQAVFERPPGVCGARLSQRRLEKRGYFCPGDECSWQFHPGEACPVVCVWRNDVVCPFDPRPDTPRSSVVSPPAVCSDSPVDVVARSTWGDCALPWGIPVLQPPAQAISEAASGNGTNLPGLCSYFRAGCGCSLHRAAHPDPDRSVRDPGNGMARGRRHRPLLRSYWQDSTAPRVDDPQLSLCHGVRRSASHCRHPGGRTDGGARYRDRGLERDRRGVLPAFVCHRVAVNAAESKDGESFVALAKLPKRTGRGRGIRT